MKLSQVPTIGLTRISDLIESEQERRLDVALDRMITAEIARLVVERRTEGEYNGWQEAD